MYPILCIRYHVSREENHPCKPRWSNGAVRIPKAVVEEARLKEGDSLEI